MKNPDLVIWQNAERYFRNGKLALKRKEYDVAIRKLQLAGEHALKFFAKACDIVLKTHQTHEILLEIEKNEMKKLNNLLQHLSPKRRSSLWKKLKSLSKDIDRWEKTGSYNNGTSFNWGACPTHEQLTFGDKLYPLGSIGEAITQEDAETFYQKVTKIRNLVKEAILSFKEKV